MKAMLLGLILTAFVPASTLTQVKCRSAKATDETTRWGGNHWNVKKDEITYRSLKGSVKMSVNDSSFENVLVEVFDQPDYLLCEWISNNANGCTIKPPATQRRLASCTTGKNGKFGVTGLTAGKYELRVSGGAGWNVEHFYVNVDPKNGKNSRIPIEMTVGD